MVQPKISFERRRRASVSPTFFILSIVFLLVGTCVLFWYFDLNVQSRLLLSNSNGEKSIETLRAKSVWPGEPKEILGYPLVMKGQNFIPAVKSMFQDTNSALLEEFLSLYEGRPDKVNLCGIRINHALALFATIKYLKPTAIIESGVNAGVSTYIMRVAAGPKTKIFAIDPLDTPICGQGARWIDSNDNTEYFTGANFQDFSEIDWKNLVKEKNIDPKDVLVYFDDHLNIFDRFPALMKNSFRHVLLEDNYKVGEGKTTFLVVISIPTFIVHEIILSFLPLGILFSPLRCHSWG
jgi:hypothetical protein